jgi:Protein of Unknown function (DUF2784)
LCLFSSKRGEHAPADTRAAGSQQKGTCPIFAASVLVEAVLFLHLLWCVWVLLGWTVTRCRRLLRTLHIASLIYAIVIELVPWPPCPLTMAETWLEARAGIEPAHESLLVRVLDAIVYPDLPELIVVGGAVLVCVAILCVYLRRYLRRTAFGQW